MSELLQSAQPLHPDADQLSAFAEQALPLHERQALLLHLAACADCRKVVFLAQQAKEFALPKEAPATPRKPWLSGWNLAWPAAAALACAGVATVKLRSLHEAERVAPPTVARMEEVAPPTPASQANIPPSIAAPKPLPIPTMPAKAVPHPSKDLPIDGRNAAPMVPATASPMAIDGAIHGAIQSPSSRVMLGAAAGAGQAQGAMAQGAMAQQQSLAATNNSMAALRARVSGPAQTQQINGGVQAYAQGAAVPAAKAVQPVVIAAAPMAAPAPPPKPVVSTDLDTLSDSASVENKATATLAGLAGLPSSLPSRLAVRSSIANGGKTVAIDSNGQVFFSKDGGKHWQSVRVQWTGRAQQVSFEPAEKKERNVPQVNNEPATSFSYAGDESGNHPVHLTIEHNRSLQDDFADIIGSVTDQSGAVIPGATVTVQEDVKEPTRNLRVTRTNAQGQYLLTAVPDGKLRLVIASPGFITLTQTFEVVSRDRATLHSVLTVASSTQTVEVSAANSEIALDTVLKKKISPATFELTTDSGAIWTSTDGKKWKQK